MTARSSLSSDCPAEELAHEEEAAPCTAPGSAACAAASPYSATSSPDAFLDLLSPARRGGGVTPARRDAALPLTESDVAMDGVEQSLGAAVANERAAAVARARAASPVHRRQRSHVGGLARLAARTTEDELDEAGDAMLSIIDALDDASEIRDGILDEAAGLATVVNRAELVGAIRADAWLESVVRPTRRIAATFATAEAKIAELEGIHALRVERVKALYDEERVETLAQVEQMRFGAAPEEAALLATVQLAPTAGSAALAERLLGADAAQRRRRTPDAAATVDGGGAPRGETSSMRTQRRAASSALSARAAVDAQLLASTAARDAVAARLAAMEVEAARRKRVHEETNDAAEVHNASVANVEIPRLDAAAESARRGAERTVATLTGGWAQTNALRNETIPELEALIERRSVRTITATLDGKRLAADLARFDTFAAATAAANAAAGAWLAACAHARAAGQVALDGQLFAAAKMHVQRTEAESGEAGVLRARIAAAQALETSHAMPPHAPPLPSAVLDQLPPPPGVDASSALPNAVVAARARAATGETSARAAGREAMASVSTFDTITGTAERYVPSEILTKKEKRARAAAAEAKLSEATKDVLLQQRELAATLARLSDRKRTLGWTQNAEAEIARAAARHDADLAKVTAEIATVQRESDALQQRTVEKSTRLARQLRVAQMNELSEMEAVMEQEQALASARIALQTISADTTEAKAAALANERALRDATRRLARWNEKDVADVASFKRRAKRRRRWERRAGLSVRAAELTDELDEVSSKLPTLRMQLAVIQQGTPQREQALAANAAAQRRAEAEIDALRVQLEAHAAAARGASATGKSDTTEQFAQRAAQLQIDEASAKRERLVLERIKMSSVSEEQVDELAAKVDASQARAEVLTAELVVVQAKAARVAQRRKPHERLKRKAARAAAAKLLREQGGDFTLHSVSDRPETAAVVVEAEIRRAIDAGDDTESSWSSSGGDGDPLAASEEDSSDAFAALLGGRAVPAGGSAGDSVEVGVSRRGGGVDAATREEHTVLADDSDVVGRLMLEIENGTVKLGVLEGEAADWAARVIDQSDVQLAVSARLTELRLASVDSSKALAEARQEQQREASHLDEMRGTHARQKREATSRAQSLQETCDILVADMSRADRRSVANDASHAAERDEIMARIAVLSQKQKIARDEAEAADALEKEASAAVARVAVQLERLRASEPAMQGEWEAKAAAATEAHARRIAAVAEEQRNLDIAISDLRNQKDDALMETADLMAQIEGPLKEEVDEKALAHAELRTHVRDQAAQLVAESAAQAALREALRVALRGQTETEELEKELGELQAKIMGVIGQNSKFQRDVDAVPKLRDGVASQQAQNSEIKLQLNLILSAIKRMEEETASIEAKNALIVKEGESTLEDISDLRKRIEREGDRVQHVAERVLGEISRLEVRVEAARERERKALKNVRRWERKMANVTGDANVAHEEAAGTIAEAKQRRNALLEETEETIVATKVRVRSVLSSQPAHLAFYAAAAAHGESCYRVCLSRCLSVSLSYETSRLRVRHTHPILDAALVLPSAHRPGARQSATAGAQKKQGWRR